MSRETKIQWCDSTSNPTMGCEGCELWSKQRKTCYAGVMHTFHGNHPGFAPTFEEVTEFPGRMAEATRWSDLTGTSRKEKPWLNGMPRTIFVSDMSDSLSSVVPFEYLEAEIIANVTSDLGQRHQWLWLTKRPDRMAEFSLWLENRGVSWPWNLWAGTSITTQATTTRIDKLLNVGDSKTIRFLSVEPQVEAINLSKWLPKLDWVIQGGESGHGARPFDVQWAYDLIVQCKQSDVPYFLKQLGAVVVRNGKPLSLEDGHGGDWNEWPKAIRVRQMPRIIEDVVEGESELDGAVSASSYLPFIIAILRRRKGVLSAAAVNNEVYRAFRSQMTEADFQLRKRSTMPRWQNMVDWAKAIGAKDRILATVTYKKKRLVVLLDPDVTSARWIKFAKKRRGKRKNFKKRCLKCHSYQPLGRTKCEHCGAEMPVSKKRRVVLGGKNS